jgi:hypothetical protein
MNRMVVAMLLFARRAVSPPLLVAEHPLNRLHSGTVPTTNTKYKEIHK